jgi:hypothetical protein
MPLRKLPRLQQRQKLVLASILLGARRIEQVWCTKEKERQQQRCVGLLMPLQSQCFGLSCETHAATAETAAAAGGRLVCNHMRAGCKMFSAYISVLGFFSAL